MTDNAQGCTATCVTSPAPCNTCMMPAWPALHSNHGIHLAVPNVHIRTHISLSIIYTCGIRRADEQDLGLKLCKQKQLLPTPTTTKQRSPEVLWVPSNCRARNNQRVRKQEEQKLSPYRRSAKGAQALLMQTEGNHKQDRQEHSGLARAGERHVVTRVRQRIQDMPLQEEGLGQGSALSRAELKAGILECDLEGSPEYAP